MLFININLHNMISLHILFHLRSLIKYLPYDRSCLPSYGYLNIYIYSNINIILNKYIIYPKNNYGRHFLIYETAFSDT